MKCPYCGDEMQKGGIIAFGTSSVRWLPQIEYDAVHKERSTSDGYDLGEVVFLEGAWSTRENIKLGKTHFCHNCYKAVGIFDINL